MSLCALLLAACGGESAGPAGNNSSSSSSSSSNSSSSSSGAAVGAALFEQMCIGSCHSSVNEPVLVKNYDLAQLTQVIDKSMPFPNSDSCVGECASSIASYIAANNPNFGKVQAEARFDDIEMPTGQVDAAPVRLNRLNNTQYNNTVQDLFGTAQTPADNFPEDSTAFGFYNTIAGSLTVSLTHVEQYVAAAEALAEEVVSRPSASRLGRFEAETQQTVNHTTIEGNLLTLRSTGSRMIANFDAPAAGTYNIIVRAGQDAAENVPANMLILVDGVEVGSTDVAVPRTAMMNYSFTTSFAAGPHTLVVEFTNDVFVEGVLNRNLVLDWVEVQNKNGGAVVNVIPCDIATGISCARQFINEFGLKAWRRPLTNNEKLALESLFQQAAQTSGDEATAFRVLVKAFLLSPNFLYRPEIDLDMHSLQPRMLDPYELASRVSYFLWNTMPDEELFSVAANGSLVQENVLRAQVRRMLQDERAKEALVGNFFKQWLKYEDITEPSPDIFPDFAPKVIDSMRMETHLFLESLFVNNTSINEIISADYTYLNGTLAQHYGVPGITGDKFVRHQWSDSQRRGILGQGSVLLGTSYPNRTSPVIRGAWVLENLICKAPGEVPDGVVVDIQLDENLTIREQSELHRDSSTVCYSCHSLMDPIGFGLENFDAAGQWREMEGRFMVNASGELPGGLQFNGALQLSEILGGSPRVPLCTIEHMMTYAIGRGIEAFHHTKDGSEPKGYATVYDVWQKAGAGGYSIHRIIEEIVLSPAFRMRRGAETEEL